MKTVCFIRHGLTVGNRERRYIGSTDQPLCAEGRAQAAALKAAGLPEFHRIFSSPYRRCRETAEILFPYGTPILVEELRECDFGLFEGRCAAELADSAPYAAWLETDCMGPIPGGEDVTAFRQRCQAAFLGAMEQVAEGGRAAFVIHGGCIMAILEAFALPRRTFYDYHLKNCGLVYGSFRGRALTLTGGV